MLGVDHDNTILLSVPFPTIPMFVKNWHCCCGVIVFYVGNKRRCIVYCNSTVPPSFHFGMRHQDLTAARPTSPAYVDGRKREHRPSSC